MQKKCPLFEFPSFLLNTNLGQPMYSLSALKELPSPNLAPFLLLDPSLPRPAWVVLDYVLQTILCPVEIFYTLFLSQGILSARVVLSTLVSLDHVTPYPKLD